jgi:hypothetical protein
MLLLAELALISGLNLGSLELGIQVGFGESVSGPRSQNQTLHGSHLAAERCLAKAIVPDNLAVAA